MSALNRTSCRKGFTLIELLVVIAIVVTMVSVLIGGLGGTGESSNLQSAQSKIGNVITVARSKAISSQRRTRIMFQADISGTQPNERFLSFFVMQQVRTTEANWRFADSWETIKSYKLPLGTYFLPFDLIEFPQLLSSSRETGESNWEYHTSKFSGKGSLLFQGGSISVDLGDGFSEGNYQGVMFTERGTISIMNGGGAFEKDIGHGLLDVIVATGTPQSPDVVASGGAPVLLTNADSVRAVLVSTYSVPILVNNREDF